MFTLILERIHILKHIHMYLCLHSLLYCLWHAYAYIVALAFGAPLAAAETCKEAGKATPVSNCNWHSIAAAFATLMLLLLLPLLLRMMI